MLRTLSIRDVVLIDRLELTFRPGLSVLTGETGAGKSILLDALGLALGARGEAALIRHGADQAVVSAAFDVAPQHLARSLAKDQGLDVADDDLVVRRVLSRDGRSRAFVNDQPASVTLLRQLGAALVEIEGQFAEQGLLDARTHRTTLDSFAGIEAEALAVRSGFSAWREAQAALEAEESMIARLRDEEAALRLALGELEALDPKADEEDGLAAERGLLMNREQLVDAVNAALDRLGSAGERAGADEAIRQAERALSQVAAKAAGRLDHALSALERARIELGEAESALQSFGSTLDHDSGHLEKVEERLFALRALARKHAVAVADLPDLRARLTHQVAALEGRSQDHPRLKRERDEARAQFIAGAKSLSAKRTKAARLLDRRVAAELPPLKLEKAAFRTELTALPPDQWSENGAEKVAFLVSTNPGTPLGAIERVASGGELARFLLALKVVVAGEGPGETLVFDEVDRGIGGAVAAAVGERLERLGGRMQVLVVTHSPQVAAKGGHHYCVRKEGAGERVSVRVDALEGAERREEIARMLSGAKVTDEARAQAARLLEPAGAEVTA
ncbi:MAG: DNA repair protein RecN [Alphaproteobacteria bacterium]